MSQEVKQRRETESWGTQQWVTEMRRNQQGDSEWVGEIERTSGEHEVLETKWRQSFNEKMHSHVKSQVKDQVKWGLRIAHWV